MVEHLLAKERVESSNLFIRSILDKYSMDRERLKLIVRNMKSLVEALEAEGYSNVDAYRTDTFSAPPTDYDEQWDDDDGYPD